MARIKYKDTKPEVFLRKLLWHQGFRYRINYKELPGKPDIYLSKYKTAIFVNGCFWHMHEGCKYSSIPKTNCDYWKEKLEGNVERDKKNCKELENMGINVIVIWGCEIKEILKSEENKDKKMNEILSIINDNARCMKE